LAKFGQFWKARLFLNSEKLFPFQCRAILRCGGSWLIVRIFAGTFSIFFKSSHQANKNTLSKIYVGLPIPLPCPIHTIGSSGMTNNIVKLNSLYRPWFSSQPRNSSWVDPQSPLIRSLPHVGAPIFRNCSGRSNKKIINNMLLRNLLNFSFSRSKEYKFILLL